MRKLHLEFHRGVSAPLYLFSLQMICQGGLSEGMQSVLYADDTKIFRSIYSAADCDRVEQALIDLT